MLCAARPDCSVRWAVTSILKEAAVNGRLPLLIAVLAAVKTILPRLDLLLALWCDRNPMFNGSVPVQIAVLDYFAYLQKPGPIRQFWCGFTHNVP